MRRALLLCAGLLGAGLAGCVERSLSIHSDPPGAAVYLDGEKLGTTPCDYTYIWYGTHDLVLELRGYSLVRREVTLNPPWWQIIPLDFITDVLIPFTLRDHVSVSYTFEVAPISQEELDAVLRRADELRQKAHPGRLPQE